MTEPNVTLKVAESLNQKGWNSHDIFYYKLDFLIPSNSKKQIADVVLIRGSIPIGVIEVKSGLIELSNSISKVREYANALDVKFIFITNGNEIFQVFNGSGVVNILSEFPSVDEIQQLLQHLN